MTLAERIAAAREALRAALATFTERQAGLVALRDQIATAAADQVETLRARIDAEVAGLDEARTARDAAVTALDSLERDAADVAENARLAQRAATLPGAPAGAERAFEPGGSEELTYRRDQDPRGGNFSRDVLFAARGDGGAAARLARHADEMRGEFGLDGPRDQAGSQQRAVGVANVAGYVIPQYLTDEYAPVARSGRPLADAMRPETLPETGMVAYISRGTTGTSVTDQAAEATVASETDWDDTLDTLNVRTYSGAQTISYQAEQRGIQVVDTILSDLFRAASSNLDSQLVNLATIGLDAVATAVTYTDGTPTFAELYPKFGEALSGIETALLDQASTEQFFVMHPRRWWWLNAATTAVWPALSQPGFPDHNLGVNYAERYGAGFRGLLPNGAPAVVTSNVPTNKGAGTNEDRIYGVDRQHAILLEEASGARYIRADARLAKNLQFDLVVYGFYAHTFARIPHARGIQGTGLITPTF